MITLIYDSLSAFTEGSAWAKTGNKWGMIDNEGNVLHDFSFDNCTSFWQRNDGLIYSWPKKNGHRGIIDNHGQMIIEPKYEYLGSWLNNRDIEFTRSNYHGVMDLSGKILIPAIFDQIYEDGNMIICNIFSRDSRVSNSDHYYTKDYKLIWLSK